MKIENRDQTDISSNGLSKVRKGTGWYMLISTTLAGGSMFCVGQVFGATGAIILGILLIIAMISAVRYNVNINEVEKEGCNYCDIYTSSTLPSTKCYCVNCGRKMV